MKRQRDEADNEVHGLFSSKKRKIDPEWNTLLLPELLKEIFNYFDTLDLCQVSLVCKYWHHLSQDFVGFAFVDSMQVWPLGVTAAFATHLAKGSKISPYKNRQNCQIGTIPLKLQTNSEGYAKRRFTRQVVAVVDNEDNLIAEIYAMSISELPLLQFASDGSWKLDSNWKLEILPRKYSNASSTTFDLMFYTYYDIRRLEKDIINGEAKNEVRLIDTAITKECTEFIQREKERLAALDKPVFPFIPPKISAPKGLKDGFKFHRYQLEAISWMRSIENNTDKEFKYCDLMPWRGSRSKIILVDLHNRKFVSSTKIDEYIGSLKSKGGILADTVGLGKTLEILGLVLDGLTRSQEILPEFDESGLLNTKATLVICPNHLTSQWCSEIAKFTDLKVTSLTTVDQIRTTTYGDIMDSDFVLIPCQTFKNKNYFSLGCGKKKVSVSMAGLNKRNTLVAQYLLEIKNGKQPTREIAGPVLDHFNWPRIIVDEAHEVFNDQFACKYMFGLQKRLAWYVSATPFPSESLFVAAKKFLEIWETDYESEQTLGDQYEECVENDLIASNLLWRNTKEGAQGEYSVPDYDEEIILTDFSPIEALLHKYGTEQDNMLLCCGLLKPSNETFDEYKKSKIKATEEAIARERTWAVGTFDFNRKQMLQNKLVDLQNIPDVMQEGVIGAEFERLQLINNYGSKMTKLIGWLKDAIKEDSNNRFILFSKYLDYLHKVAKRLLMCDIPCVLMSGTGAQKNEKLKKFKEENIQVILLSLEKSASGLNLIEANHVVLLDPMDGTVEEARATEVQALGRAHRQGQDQKVTLVRFIIQDSVEEELYLRNKTTARGTNGNTNVRRAGSKILAKSTSQTSLQRILEQ